MSNGSYIDWPGRSGRAYRYFFIDPTLGIDPVAANYAFVSRLPNGNFRPLYFGQTGDAQTRLTTAHEKWKEALQEGITHVMAHVIQDGEAVRCAEEQDLIERWQPALNIQLQLAK